jgi:hypothetical protein
MASLNAAFGVADEPKPIVSGCLFDLTNAR